MRFRVGDEPMFRRDFDASTWNSVFSVYRSIGIAVLHYQGTWGSTGGAQIAFKDLPLQASGIITRVRQAILPGAVAGSYTLAGIRKDHDRILTVTLVRLAPAEGALNASWARSRGGGDSLLVGV